MKFIDKYNQRVDQVDSLLCVGLDANLEQLPARFREQAQPQFVFNQWIIEQTHPFVSAYKPNSAFYEARGAAGWQELQLTMDYLHQQHPEIPVILDAKRADIGNTNQGYVTAIFDQLGMDAVTLHPYLGMAALAPFLERSDKGCIILCKTSNPDSGELQDLPVADGQLLWQLVAQQVASKWNRLGNCLLVVGATYPEELAQVRKLTGEMTFLVPGIGAQGGDVAATVKAGLNSAGKGLIINSARGIIFADDPAVAARELREEINLYRKKSGDGGL